MTYNVFSGTLIPTHFTSRCLWRNKSSLLAVATSHFCMATSGEPLWAPVVIVEICDVIEHYGMVGDFNAFLRQNGKSYEKTSGEREHRFTFRYQMECIIRAENKCGDL